MPKSEMAVYEFIEVEECFALVRKASCNAEDIGPTVSRLFAEIGNSHPNLESVGPPMLKYLKWEPPYCEVELACPIEAGSPIAPGFETKTYPACTALYTEHVGPYEGLAKAWLDLWNYAQVNGIQGDMPCWDTYVTDPHSEPNSAKWVTELYVPIRKI